MFSMNHSVPPILQNVYTIQLLGFITMHLPINMKVRNSKMRYLPTVEWDTTLSYQRLVLEYQRIRY